MFFVAIGIGVASWMINRVVPDSFGLLAVVLISAASLFLLMKFCFVTLVQGIVAVVVFFGYLLAFQALLDRWTST